MPFRKRRFELALWHTDVPRVGADVHVRLGHPDRVTERDVGAQETDVLQVLDGALSIALVAELPLVGRLDAVDVDGRCVLGRTLADPFEDVV